MKNISTTSHQSYKLLFIDKIKNVIKRMRWKAYFFMENKAATPEEPSKHLKKTCLTWPTHSNSDEYTMTFNKK